MRKIIALMRGISSAGRAPALQAGGRRFDPVILHQEVECLTLLCVYRATLSTLEVLRSLTIRIELDIKIYQRVCVVCCKRHMT